MKEKLRLKKRGLPFFGEEGKREYWRSLIKQSGRHIEGYKNRR